MKHKEAIPLNSDDIEYVAAAAAAKLHTECGARGNRGVDMCAHTRSPQFMQMVQFPILGKREVTINGNGWSRNQNDFFKNPRHESLFELPCTTLEWDKEIHVPLHCTFFTFFLF